MIDLPVTLTSNGHVQLPGYGSFLCLGYTKNRGAYRLRITATGEWEGLTIRACVHMNTAVPSLRTGCGGCDAERRQRDDQTV